MPRSFKTRCTTPRNTCAPKWRRTPTSPNPTCSNFVIAVVGLSVSLVFIFAPLVDLAGRYGWFDQAGGVHLSPAWLGSLWAMPLLMLAGVVLLTLLMHLARGVGRLHATSAKSLLVAPTVTRAAQ